MARLSNIFANLNGESDLIKQKYFAEKIVECFEVQGLTEGYVFSDFDLTTINQNNAEISTSSVTCSSRAELSTIIAF